MLEIRKINVKYGQREVIHDLSLEVPAGGVVTLIGSNGAGKTTVLKTVSGLLRPTSGSILFEGRPIEKAEPHAIIEAGVVHIPEGRLLFRPFIEPSYKIAIFAQVYLLYRLCFESFYLNHKRKQ